MKKIILALAMVALAATVALGAYSNHGNINAASSTDAITVSWAGASANYLVVTPASADVTVVFVPDRNDDGTPFTVEAGTSKTIYYPDFYGFTITRSTATACDVDWGVR